MVAIRMCVVLKAMVSFYLLALMLIFCAAPLTILANPRQIRFRLTSQLTANQPSAVCLATRVKLPLTFKKSLLAFLLSLL